ncbi:hypothetical protein CWI38_2382p0010, partial [Hamiltosporidium tvaerminnensis]
MPLPENLKKIISSSKIHPINPTLSLLLTPTYFSYNYNIDNTITLFSHTITSTINNTLIDSSIPSNTNTTNNTLKNTPANNTPYTNSINNTPYTNTMNNTPTEEQDSSSSFFSSEETEPTNSTDKNKDKSKDIDMDKSKDIDMDKSKDIGRDKSKDIDRDKSKDIDRDKSKDIDRDKSKDIDRDIKNTTNNNNNINNNTFYKFIPTSFTPPPIKHPFPYKLDPFQLQSIYLLNNNKHTLVTAHTSSGKTLIAHFLFNNSINNNTTTIYTSPLKALCNQKYYNTCEYYKGYRDSRGGVSEEGCGLKGVSDSIGNYNPVSKSTNEQQG